jgi:transposase
MTKARRKVGPEATGAGASTERDESAAASGPTVTVTPVPDPEVAAKPTRRRFTAEYKLRVLREAESQREPGAIGALLRREGLYSTHLTAWRRQREGGALEAMRQRRRGRKPDPAAGARQRIVALEAENTRLEERLRQAEAIIAAQKKFVMGSTPTPHHETRLSFRRAARSETSDSFGTASP